MIKPIAFCILILLSHSVHAGYVFPDPAPPPAPRPAPTPAPAQAPPPPSPAVCQALLVPQVSASERALEKVRFMADALPAPVSHWLKAAPRSSDLGEDRGALKRVNEFFTQLNARFFEREELIEAFRRAFIAEGSILILGPGGTAKSDIADSIGTNLVDAQGKSSYYSLQLTADTTSSETMGGLDMKDAMKGRTVRNWMEGVLGSKIVFLDEFFDGRLKFLRSFLKAFNERIYTQGRLRVEGLTKMFIAASNMYLNEIYEEYGDNKPRALIDRFQYVYYAPGVLKKISSILSLAMSERGEMTQLQFEDLDKISSFARNIPISEIEVLRAQYIFSTLRRDLQRASLQAQADTEKKKQQGEKVQPAYRPTRIFSPRSLKKAFHLIKIEALIRDSDQAGVEVEAADVDRALARFLVMQGPHVSDIQAVQNSADTDPYEKTQLMILRLESDALNSILKNLHEKEKKLSERLAYILSLQAMPEKSDAQLEQLYVQIYNYLTDTMSSLETMEDADSLTDVQVAALGGLRAFYAHPELNELLRK